MPALPLFTVARLRQIEETHRAEPLMQRAGEAAACWAETLALDCDGAILICAGPGNNGGDAFEAAARLRQRHFDVVVVFNGDAATLHADAAAAYARYGAAGGMTVAQIPPNRRWRLIIDGLFGIGLTRAPQGDDAKTIQLLNALAAEQNCPLLALDCPSGLNADSGVAQLPAIQASHTLSFIAGKPGLFTADGPDHCGEVRIAPLELPAYPGDGHTIAREQFAARLLPRRQNSHKGTYGSAGVLGGAHSMLGAVLLTGRAALRLGAGRVYLGPLCPEAPPFDPLQPELMLRKPEGLFGAGLSALACGPGLGTSLQAAELLEHSLGLEIPLVLDADALNLLALDGKLQARLAARNAPTLLTPHPGETARLLDAELGEVTANRLAAAREIAQRCGAHVVLKGCGSLVVAPDGRWWINTTGNAGLASAGSGDVLTGFALALLAQGWPISEAALAAVHLHGAAADRLVALGHGPIGLTASELIDSARGIFNGWVSGE